MPHHGPNVDPPVFTTGPQDALNDGNQAKVTNKKEKTLTATTQLPEPAPETPPLDRYNLPLDIPGGRAETKKIQTTTGKTGSTKDKYEEGTHNNVADGQPRTPVNRGPHPKFNQIASARQSTCGFADGGSNAGHRTRLGHEQ